MIVHVIHGAATKEKTVALRALPVPSSQVLAIGGNAKRKLSEREDQWTITFTEQDLKDVQLSHSDALVISV